MRHRILFSLLFLLVLLSVFVLWPELDLLASALFFEAGKGFIYADHSVFVGLHWLAYFGARFLGFFLLGASIIAFLRRNKLAGLDAKAWLFLFLALILGPVLIANVIFKDHWGRARPREVTEFGGPYVFSAALYAQNNGRKNGSFVSGDPAFGFYLTSFAYMLPMRLAGKKTKTRKTLSLSQRVFWGMILAGCLFGVTRLAMGAHFLSDILFAAFFMLASAAVLHAVFYGRHQTAIYWRHWLFEQRKGLDPET